MIILLFAIMLAIIIGLIAGFLPGIGNTLIVLAMAPILLTWPPEISILFYAVLIQCANFSGSVSALNLGILGDTASEPALRERSYVVTNNLSIQALRYTALGSVVACVISIGLFVIFLDWASHSSIILRSEFRFLVLWIITIAVLWWPNNKMIYNLILLIIGLILTAIGHYDYIWNVQDVHILTFNQTFLHGGIPTISILTTFLAIPALIKLHKNLNISTVEDSLSSRSPTTTVAFNFSSSIRGSIIGSILGVLPMVGYLISSNVAWSIERLLNKNLTPHQRSMNRLISAESANNSSNVTVLIPLLIFGLAIVPSEIVLLSIIQTRGWTLDGDWSILGIGFYYWLFFALIVACVISYMVCYTFVQTITGYLKNNINLISAVTLIMIAASLIYSGWMINNYLIFLLTFSVFSVVILLLKDIDYMPLVVGFMLGDQLLNVTGIVYNLHF